MPPDQQRRRRSQVLLCADANPAAGLGPLRRCCALATELRRCGIRSGILLHGRGPAADWFVAHGETFQCVDQEADSAEAAAREAARCGARVVVLDSPNPVGRRCVMTLRRAGHAVVMIENHGPGRLVADLCVSAAVNPAVSWRGALGERVTSPAYAILGESFRPTAKQRAGAVRVLVTLGGHDPGGLTDALLAALNRIEDPTQLILVVGPGYKQHDQLRETLATTAHRWEVHHGPLQMAPLVATAEVAVTAFGLSAYELAAAGVPAVLVPRRRADRWHANLFAAAGAAVIAEATPEAIADAVRPLVVGREMRRRFSLVAEQFVDGRGAERVAELITRLLSRRSRHRTLRYWNAPATQEDAERQHS